MSTRLPKKLLMATVPVGIAVACAAAPTLAKGLGNGPTGPTRTPSPVALAPSQPLVDLQFKNGLVTGLTGTAVPKNMQRRPTGFAPRMHTKCTVNFNHNTRPDNGDTLANWFGGIGCARAMFLFGQATLNQSATTINGVGAHYQANLKSASSGRNNTLIKAPHPSLYVVHFANVYFTGLLGTGRITVYPAPGQQVNAATRCISATAPGHGLGVHCDLYTSRF
jgi:hypothetical protein